MTAPEDQNGLREALARAEAERDAERAKMRSEFARSEAHRNDLMDSIVSLKIERGALRAHLSVAEAERDAALATVAEVEEWTGSRDGWVSLKAKMDLIVIGAEKAEDRHDAEEARANAIQATLDAEMEIQAEVRASLRAAEAEITRLKEGMEELGAALRPFAEAAAGWDRHSCGVRKDSPWPDSEGIDGGEKYSATIYVGDLRRARSALATLSPKEHPHG